MTELLDLRATQLASICKKYKAENDLRRNKATKEVTVRRILQFERDRATLGIEGSDDEDDPVEADDSSSEPLSKRCLEVLRRREMAAQFFRDNGVPQSELELLSTDLVFPPQETAQLAFCERAEDDLKAEVARLKQLNSKKRQRNQNADQSDSAQELICILCDAVEEVDPARGVCKDCKDAHKGSSTDDKELRNAKRRRTLQNAKKSKANPGNDSAFYSFPCMDDTAFQLVPGGGTEMDGDTFWFINQFDKPVLDATLKRGFVPLHHYRNGRFEEVASKLHLQSTANSAVVVASDGSVSTTQTMKFSTKPIKSAEHLLQCLDNLHRLELQFRTRPHTILNDSSSVREWVGLYGWQATLECIEKLRLIRMANKSYDSIGLATPDQQLFAKMAVGYFSGGPGHPISGNASSNYKKGMANSKADKTRPARPNKPFLSQDVAAKCSDNNWCIKFQTGFCKEPGDHVIKPRDPSKPNYTVSHKCAKCKKGDHGFTSCPN